MRAYDKLRKHPRYPVDFAVDLVDDREVLSGEARNLSSSGLQLVLPERAKRGERFQLKFSPGNGTPALQPVAVVRWCRAGDNGYLTGLEFDAVEAAERDRLEAHIAAELERRRHRRVDIRIPAQARRLVPAIADPPSASNGGRFESLDDWIDAYGKDISRSGMRIQCEAAFHPGDHVHVALTMRNGHVLMQADGRVAWCRSAGDGGGHHVAVEFTDLDGDSADFLRSLINSM